MAVRGIPGGGRFSELRHANEDDPNQPPEMVEAQGRGLRYHRICAATREKLGNDAVGSLYKAWGELYWYTPGDGDLLNRLATSAQRLDPAELLQSLNLPDALLEAADDDSWDGVIRAETDAAFRLTGRDFGTPIITSVPPDVNSLFV